jgi:hypothetical protein
MPAYSVTAEVLAAMSNLTRLDVRGSMALNYFDYGREEGTGEGFKVC